MKNFIGKVLILGVFFIPFAFVFPAVLDPYNVFHYKNVRDNGLTPNQNYIKMRYLLDNPGTFDSFVVGSSKVGPIDVDKINPGRWYNMTHAWGTPKEYYENLRVLMDNGIVPAAVLLGIDTASGWLDPEINTHILGNKPYPMYQTTGKLRYTCFLLQYCNPAALSSLWISIRHKGDTPAYQKQFYQNGGKSRTAQKAKYNWDNLPLQLQTRFATHKIEDRIEEVGQIQGDYE